jgi:hypothetical protein
MSKALEVLLRPNSIADRLQVALDENAELTDWDQALARFLLAFVGRNCPKSVADSSRQPVDGFAGIGATPQAAQQPKSNHPIGRRGRRATRIDRAARTSAGKTRRPGVQVASAVTCLAQETRTAPNNR